MQGTYYKNFRRNMEKITERLEDKRKRTKRGIIRGEDSLVDTLQENCLVGQMGNMMDSIDRDWKEIGSNGKR